MKRAFITFLMSFSLFGLFGQTKHTFSSVSVAEFEKSVSDTSYVVLDVRTAEEHSQGYITGTDFNIDVLDKGFEKDALKLLPKGKGVALYCRSGNRSKNAAKILSENGYKVIELAPGIRGWMAAGKPVSAEHSEL